MLLTINSLDLFVAHWLAQSPRFLYYQSVWPRLGDASIRYGSDSAILHESTFNFRTCCPRLFVICQVCDRNHTHARTSSLAERDDRLAKENKAPLINGKCELITEAVGHSATRTSHFPTTCFR